MRHGGFGFSTLRNQMYGAYAASYLEALYPAGLTYDSNMIATDFGIREMSRYIRRTLPHISSNARTDNDIRDGSIETFFSSMMPFNFTEMRRQRDCSCLPQTLDRFEDALDKVSAIPRIRNCLFTNHIVKEAAKMYNAQCSDTVRAQNSFIIHHPTLLAPFPSHLFPPEKRRDISRDLCYGSITDAALREYHQPARPSSTTARRRQSARLSKQPRQQMMMQSSLPTPNEMDNLFCALERLSSLDCTSCLRQASLGLSHTPFATLHCVSRCRGQCVLDLLPEERI